MKKEIKPVKGNEWIMAMNAIREKIGKEKFEEAINKRNQLGQHLIRVLNIQGLLNFDESKKLIYNLFKEHISNLKYGNLQSIVLKEDSSSPKGYRFYIKDENDQEIEVVPNWIPSFSIKNKIQYLIGYDEYEQLEKMIRGEQEEEGVAPKEYDSKVKFSFYDIVKDAYSKRASDIHINYSNDETYRVMFRIDGVLVEQQEYMMQERDGLKLVKAIKNEATKYTKGKFNADKNFIPQDARIAYENIGGFGLDLRLSFIPNGTLEKEALVARLLERKILKEPNFKAMGYREDIIDILQQVSLMANGLVIVSGVTGSGKSTLLNNIITSIPKDKKVHTAEDPIEYLIMKPNVVQHQVYIPPANDEDRANKIMGFKELAKAFKRSDPNVVLIGETRKDPELIETLIEMSEAGQLVFTTIHITSAFSIYTALENAFFMPKKISVPMIKLSVNQSLMRKLCPHCKVPDKNNENKNRLRKLKNRMRYAYKKKLHEFLDSEVETFVAGKGCPHCNYTGYKGRVPVYEYLYPTVEMQEWLFAEDRLPVVIEKKACEDGIGKNKLTTMIEAIMEGVADTNPRDVNQILL